MRSVTRNVKASPFFKDSVLDDLAEENNVARFVSFGIDHELQIRHNRILRGEDPTVPEKVIETLLKVSVDHLVNVRSFHPSHAQGNEFIYGLNNVDDVLFAVRRFSRSGLYSIVNETIDIHDGGVSGVAMGGVLEFAPDDTPRCVEKPGVASLPLGYGMDVLRTVYGFELDLDLGIAAHERIEFSIHPTRRGLRNEHTIVWEKQQLEDIELTARLQWPNHFSRMLGDKTYGLLLADEFGLPVPATTVFSRRLSPFGFGRSTGTHETWIRTCPSEQRPGQFTTRKGWTDPFKLLANEDPDGEFISSVIAQEGVDSVYSGALVAGKDGEPFVEGVRGTGEDFMLGKVAPDQLPSIVVASITDVFNQAYALLGPVRLEWAFDGTRTWILQLHRGSSEVSTSIVFAGHASKFHRFVADRGVEELRGLIASIDKEDGVTLVGNVGVTSHLGDLLRRARVPSRIEHPGS